MSKGEFWASTLQSMCYDLRCEPEVFESLHYLYQEGEFSESSLWTVCYNLKLTCTFWTETFLRALIQTSVA